jgi:hypothetical protein
MNIAVKKLKKINQFLNKNTLLIFIAFIITLCLSILVYCSILVKIRPELIDANGELQITSLGFNLYHILTNLLEGKPAKEIMWNIDFYVHKMPLQPYFLYLFYSLVSKKLIIFYLFKNLLFGTLIFLLIKFYDKKLNNFFLVVSMLSIFYIPHNLVTIFSLEYEEGFLAYLLITLFLTITGNYKYKPIIASIILCLIFFLKSSMFYLVGGISITYFFLEKKYNYLPFLIFIFCSFLWGLNSYNKTGKFAFATSSTSFNGTSLGMVYHKEFTKYYPLLSPDMFQKKQQEEIKKLVINNEWEAHNYFLNKSKKYIRENPKDVFYGLLKKIYVIFLSPYKDTRTSDQFIEKNNPIRYSNFPNKIIFILSIIVLIKYLIGFKNLNLSLQRRNIYFIMIVGLYFFPYLVGFVYSRHCIPIYILAHIYLIIQLFYPKKIR